MTNILFIKDQNADGRHQETVGTLTPEGVWTGDRRLELDVRSKIRAHDINLLDPAGRRALLQSFSGPYLFAVEQMNL